jgi:hypothetical protein
MSFEAESNSELTMIVPAYQLHFRCRTKYTNKKFCRTPGPPYLAVLPVLVIFCQLGPTNFKKSVLIRSTLPHFSNTRHLFLSAYFVVLCIDEKSFYNVYYCFKFVFSINAPNFISMMDLHFDKDSHQLTPYPDIWKSIDHDTYVLPLH